MSRVARGLWCCLLLLLLPTGCRTTSPDQVVQVAVLNANRVTMSFRPGFFQEMKAYKRSGGFAAVRNGEVVSDGTAVESIRTMHIEPIEEAMERIAMLRPADDEAHALVEASRDLLLQGREMFEHDYLRVAALIDEERPEAEIDAAIQQVHDRNAGPITQKSERLGALAEAYAAKHGIDLAMR